MRQNVDILRMNDPKRLPVVEMSDKETADNIRRLIMQPNSVDISPSILVHYCWCSQRCGQQQDDRFQEWCDQRKERWTEKDYNGIGFSSCVLLEYAHSLDPQMRQNVDILMPDCGHIPPKAYECVQCLLDKIKAQQESIWELEEMVSDRELKIAELRSIS